MGLQANAADFHGNVLRCQLCAFVKEQRVSDLAQLHITYDRDSRVVQELFKRSLD